MTTEEIVEVHPFDSVHNLIKTSESYIMDQINDYFTFEVPNARHMPLVKNGIWDGKIRLLERTNYTTGGLYCGLSNYLHKFCEEHGYTLDWSNMPVSMINPDSVDMDEFIEGLTIPFEPREYQLEAVKHTIINKRTLLLSPTSSGKTFISYLLCRYLNDSKILIVTPRVSLVDQLKDDFQSYSEDDDGFNTEDEIFKVSGKKTGKNSDKRIIVSTWQSIYKMDVDYFNQFDCVIIDEAHQATANSLKGILEKCKTCQYKIGMTGTLEDAKCHRLMIEGLTGPVKVVTTTKELMARKEVSNVNVKAVMLRYKDKETGLSIRREKSYKFETDLVMNSEVRNRFIANLALSREGNTLIMVDKIEKHLYPLFDTLEQVKDEIGYDKLLLKACGPLSQQEKDQVKPTMNVNNNVVLVASYAYFSTGISINNIQHLMFAASSKNQIRILQTAGRGIRLDGKKNILTLWDIIDDFSVKSYKNYAMRHYLENKFKYYKNSGFKVKEMQIEV